MWKRASTVLKVWSERLRLESERSEQHMEIHQAHQEHNQTVLDQFSKQAAPFAEKSPLSDDAILQLILDASGVGPDDTVLDVACGPGLVSCALARRAAHVTGVDLTPAMIAKAAQIQK